MRIVGDVFGARHSRYADCYLGGDLNVLPGNQSGCVIVVSASSA